ncbi:MAG: hypothetical protein JXA21_21715 [Anaerolineae bacterium]|nr:hypothetical protein [Anaerolineae bacterium]
MENWSLSWLEALSGGLPGPTRLRVQGRSMLPTLRPGDEVLVEPATADALLPGDFVVVAGAPGGFLHRFLGRRGDQVLTKGDGHFSLDPAWPPQAVLGRVTNAWRAERCIYRRTGGRLRRERWLALGHHALGNTWDFLRRVKALLVSLLLVALMAAGVYAAVDVSDFHTELEGETIVLYWTTGSETGNMGFYVFRSAEKDVEYEELTYQASKDEGAGAVYTYPDSDIDPGVIYYYRLEDDPASASEQSKQWETTGILPATTEEPPDETSTPTPTPTPSPTPSPTSTPHPNVRFWATKSELKPGDCTSILWMTNNVNAVYFDGDPVVGDGSQTVCPQSTTVYTLNVTFSDGSGDAFYVTLTVAGDDDGDDDETATPTPQPTATNTPAAGATSETQLTPVGAPTLTPTPGAPVRFPGTGTPPPTVTPAPGTPHKTKDAPDSSGGIPASTGSPGENPSITVSPLTTPEAQVSGDATPTRIAAHSGETTPGKGTASSDWTPALLVFGLSVAVGLIAVGLWLWSRQQ